jgi:hypothetical protein
MLHKLSDPEGQSPYIPILSFASPTSRYASYKVLTSLEQKVKEFDKTAKYMIKKLDQTKTKIEQCDDGQTKIKLIELISQGDTLILETHGKSQELSDRLNNTQFLLRNKYKEIQSTKYLTKSIVILFIY